MPYFFEGFGNGGQGAAGAGADVRTIVSFPSTTVQYVRVVQTGSKGNWWSIHEVNAFGDESAVSLTEISFENTRIPLAIDSVIEAQPVLEPENADNKIVFWKSSNTNVATVNTDGNITGISTGVATISAVSMDGIKKADLTVVVTVEGLTSIDGLTKADDFSLDLFPNPASGDVTLSYKLGKAQEVFVDVFNTSGTLVRRTTFRSNTGDNQSLLSLKGLTTGVYFVQLRTMEGVKVKQLIIR